MTLNVAISEKTEEKCSQQSFELIAHLFLQPQQTIFLPLTQLKNPEYSLVGPERLQKNLPRNTPSCSDIVLKKKKENVPRNPSQSNPIQKSSKQHAQSQNILVK